MPDNDPFDAEAFDSPDTAETIAVFMKNIDEMVELAEKLQDISYDRITPELWNELRDRLPLIDLVMRMTKGSLMIGAQMIENPEGQAAIAAVAHTINVPGPSDLGIKISEADTDER